MLHRPRTCFLLLLSLLAPAISLADHTAQGRKGMVASSHELASEVGVQILRRGGNAVDAACAVGLALAVVHPAAGNLGGGGFMLVRLARGKSVVIDYRETAPIGSTPTMYLDKSGKVIPGESLIGYKASGVPGTVAGLALAHKRFGKLPWRMVVQPAIRLASDGFTVSKSLAAELRQARNLAQFPESRRVFQRDGAYYKEGDTFRQPELAHTLERIARFGARDFYRGRTAHLIAKEMQGKGLITLRDLAAYRPAIRKPLIGMYRGYQIMTMPPPSSGGVTLLETLNQLSTYKMGALGFDTAPSDHLLVETMRRSFADRSKFIGDPDFVDVPLKGLLSRAYARSLCRTILPTLATSSGLIAPGNPLAYESPETTHFSVVDRYGNAVSNTYTLNFGFGSGVTVAGAGFLMNDEMDDFTSKPGEPNGFGLIQGSANAIKPHHRPLSSMTPTIVLKGGKLCMVVGTPGGPTIITSVLQVLVNVIDHKMSLAEAIAAPRIHHQWMPDLIATERGAVPALVRTLLEAAGYRLSKGSETWGDVEAISIDPRNGLRRGVSDPRSPDAASSGY